MNIITFAVIIILGVRAYRTYIADRNEQTLDVARRWGCAFWGAILGSFFGVAGFGDAIPGTPVGALIGYLAGVAWGDQRDKGSSDVGTNASAKGAEARGAAAGPPVNSKPPESAPLSKEYYDKIRWCNQRITKGLLQVVRASFADNEENNWVDIGAEEARALDQLQFWWAAKEHFSVFLNNSSGRPLVAFEFSLTPGPSARPEGATVTRMFKFARPVLPHESLVIVFDAEDGMDPQIPVQDGKITRAWSLV